ncbi:MAG TPA: sigma-70 family RNA polymerase sigma factor [Candidatus Acidoferrum sp.]|nr:sigma-70 family RNA polymerase sigma factor [Candidatus Acidoferrum sp.]
MKAVEELEAGRFFPRQFNTTHWSVVLMAGRETSPQSAEALERLCQTYWPPLYSFIRRQGHPPQDAEDLTQKFFARLLEKQALGTVDPSKGKFRTFLLTALSHFLANERDYAQAAKRGGGKTILSLDELRPEQAYEAELAAALSPDKLFDRRWAITVLDQALAALRLEMGEAGKGSHFEQLRLFLTEEPAAGQYAEIGGRLGLSRETVAVTVHRLRRRYHELVRAEVAQTVANPLELEDELRHLFQALGG